FHFLLLFFFFFFCFFFFFFQAEDGIRDRNVTGVQTCALPISAFAAANAGMSSASNCLWASLCSSRHGFEKTQPTAGRATSSASRSEERRVGKECRSGWSPCHYIYSV